MNRFTYCVRLTAVLAVVLVMATAQPAAATNYGMAKAIKKKVGKRTSYRVAGLAKGRTFCFQIRAVRGKTTGKKSNRTCKPTIVAQGVTTGAPVRIMTYNICSTKPGCQASWNWATRRPHAAALIEAYQPDVMALQESERGDGVDSELVGYITMDQAGERYAVWAELKDTTNDHRFIFVSVHTAAGKSYTADKLRARSSTARATTMPTTWPPR